MANKPHLKKLSYQVQESVPPTDENFVDDRLYFRSPTDYRGCLCTCENHLLRNKFDVVWNKRYKGNFFEEDNLYCTQDGCLICCENCVRLNQSYGEHQCGGVQGWSPLNEPRPYNDSLAARSGAISVFIDRNSGRGKSSGLTICCPENQPVCGTCDHTYSEDEETYLLTWLRGKCAFCDFAECFSCGFYTEWENDDSKCSNCGSWHDLLVCIQCSSPFRETDSGPCAGCDRVHGCFCRSDAETCNKCLPGSDPLKNYYSTEMMAELKGLTFAKGKWSRTKY